MALAKLDLTRKEADMLDLLLDRVKAGKHEVTIAVHDFTPDQVDRVIQRAEARGFDAASDGHHILIRDLRSVRRKPDEV